MKEITKIGSRLAVICVLAGAVLGLVNSITEPRIAELRAEKLRQALSSVIPAGEIGEVQETSRKAIPLVYPVTDGEGQLRYYILKIIGNGYAGDLNLIAGYDTAGNLQGAVLMENEETPGLGKEAENEEYMAMYLDGKEGEIPTRKSDLSQEKADSITGASITFSGIGKALADGAAYVQKRGADND